MDFINTGHVDNIAQILIAPNGGASLSVMVGHDCPVGVVETCKEIALAELVVEGKVIGRIPVDGLTEEQRANLFNTTRNLCNKDTR